MKILLLFFFGASLASFAGLVVDRYPQQSLLYPRSHCSHCQRRLKWWQLCPVFSAIFLKFTCPSCQTSFPKWYSLLEAAWGLALVAWGQGWLSSSWLLLAGFGSMATIYDLRQQAYPLLLWVIWTIPLFLLVPMPPLYGLLLLLALICHFYPLGLGAGDVLYIANLLLVFPLLDWIYLVHLACLLAVAYILFSRHRGSLAFIPFLFLAFLLLTSLTLLFS